MNEYEFIQKKMMENKLPTKVNFLQEITEIIRQK